MSKLLIVIFSMLIVGCEGDNIVLNEQQRENIKNATQKRGEARYKAFVHCMELAAAMPRESVDDVHKVVGACETSAYYMTNYIR